MHALILTTILAAAPAGSAQALRCQELWDAIATDPEQPALKPIEGKQGAIRIARARRRPGS